MSLKSSFVLCDTGLHLIVLSTGGISFRFGRHVCMCVWSLNQPYLGEKIVLEVGGSDKICPPIGRWERDQGPPESGTFLSILQFIFIAKNHVLLLLAVVF